MQLVRWYLEPSVGLFYSKRARSKVSSLSFMHGFFLSAPGLEGGPWLNIGTKGSDNFEMSFWCLQFPPKNKQKQVDLRYHSSKVEFICLFWNNCQLEKIITTLSDL